MKVYLIGHKGWIGNKMIKLFKDKKIQFISSEFRAEDPNIFKDIFENNITHVFCCSGRTHGIIDDTYYNTIDYLEDPKTIFENINDNLYVPISLSLFCDKYNIHLTYIATGCIFNYDNDHTIDNFNGFTENDSPNFFGSKYSIVKGFTDKLLQNMNTLTLRIRMPIASDLNDRNFITKIIKYNKICSIKNSMTVLDEMLPLSIEMMIKKQKGVFNFTNPGTISHNEILELYRDIVDHTFKWENFDISDQDKILKSKRSNNYLDTSKLENKYKVDDIKTAVIKIMMNIRDTTDNK